MIAYDTNILIYALEGSSEWSTAAQAVVDQGIFEGAVLSILVWHELATGLVLQGQGIDKVLAQMGGRLGQTKFMAVTQSISDRAIGLTRQFGRQISGNDALVLATALEHKASVFVTNDKALLGVQRVDGLEIRGL